MRRTLVLCSAGLLSLSLPAWSDVVVVAGSKSPIGTLSRDQVTDAFMGKARSVGGASIVPIDYSNSPKEAFYGGVLGKSPSQMKAIWAKMAFTGAGVPPKELASLSDAKKQAGENLAYVIFVDRSQVDASVKIIYAP